MPRRTQSAGSAAISSLVRRRPCFSANQCSVTGWICISPRAPRELIASGSKSLSTSMMARMRSGSYPARRASSAMARLTWARSTRPSSGARLARTESMRARSGSGCCTTAAAGSAVGRTRPWTVLSMRAAPSRRPAATSGSTAQCELSACIWNSSRRTGRSAPAFQLLHSLRHPVHPGHQRLDLLASGHPEALQRPADPLLQALLQLATLGGKPLGQVTHLAPHLVLTPPGHGLGPLHDPGRLVLHAGHRCDCLGPHPLEGLYNRASVLGNLACHVGLRPSGRLPAHQARCRLIAK